MKNKDKKPLDGSFDPSKQLEKLDKLFAESISRLDSFDALTGNDEWEKVDEEAAAKTKADIDEQFMALEVIKKAKKEKKHKETKEKKEPEVVTETKEETEVSETEDSVPETKEPEDSEPSEESEKAQETEEEQEPPAELDNPYVPDDLNEKKKKKYEPVLPVVFEGEDAVIKMTVSDDEEEAIEQERLLAKEEYDKLFEELYHVEPPKKREPNLFRSEFRFINAACCLLCIFGIFAYLLFADRESGFINSENRMLATMPSFSKDSYFDGSFAKKVTEYFTDTVPGREELKRMSADITSHYGPKDDVKISSNVKVVKKEVLEEPSKIVTTATANVNIAAVVDDDSSEEDGGDGGEPKETEPEEKITTMQEQVKQVETNFDEGTVYGSVIVEGSGNNVRAVSAFYGTFENSELYAKTINKYKQELGSKVNVYNMPIPISSAYYIPKNFEDTVASQPDNIEVMRRNVKDIITVDVYPELEKHTEEYIYSRTDHHWQPLGAYYAGKIFAEAAGVNYPELSEYGRYFKEDFCGTMYMYSDYNEEIKNHPDTFTYFKPKNEYKTYYYNTDFTNKREDVLFYDYAEGVNTYSVFMGGDELICQIDTDVKNGRTLVIFKDSFGNALVPFMVGGFEHIYVVDFRYFNVNAIDFLKQVKCTDLLFAMSISSMDTPSHITTLDNDRIQYRK
ncbi:DHHW family protein [Ruminococcus sp. NK3A76]|uniref:DHHW family protein n=1 Tax=Ruminococcus sp. NK3A76 TaxID=877411 RepID=UPI00068993B3|nr:DHHW family protein [Ruminococcus sp. NK3A76]